MRNAVLVIGLIAAATACAASVAPTLPPVESLDTETVANAPVPSLAQETRRYSFSMAFSGTPSNNVEIAFGVDADHDGALADDEVALSAGWDCGEWFIENAKTGERLSAAGADGQHELLGAIVLRADGRTRSAALLDGPTPIFPSLPTTARSWTFPEAWDMARLVGRGENIRAGERFSISATAPGLAIRLQ